MTSLQVAGEIPHPLDINYESLKAKLSHIKKEEDEYQVVHKYIKATATWRKVELLDVFRVDREGEGERFSAHKELDNRKLLWHGTNVAVVAAILKSGLRIMPHSGGRVGRGIYFASECSKSAAYVRRAGNIGIMFLNEVALGKEKHITTDDSSLVKAPPGFDCIVARGRTEPDPSKDSCLEFEERKVVVPQGEPVPQPKFSQSSFSQSEYLVYRESQNCIRYLLKMKMY
ncbi:Protein mono-ADP-ribosyltransferase PARP3 [Geodia barretti]|uniref:Poly [ADP-ribose] polymerase n=1 Tax=Geodia barretti TaxID=519541 RepID=A0AA35TA70_GEOBA|nr:Protein mono-ADP-ribosyltransferase PARP3 [Geodia barretti]